MNEESPFSPGVAGFLVAGVIAIFALSVLLAALNVEEPSFGTALDSPSAIGHKGFYALLQRLQMPVAVSRVHERITTRRALPRQSGLLIVEEPSSDPRSFRESGFEAAPDVLLVLPKRFGFGDPFHSGWIDEARLTDTATPRAVLAVLDAKAGIVREPAPSTWPRNSLGAAPALSGDVQLITGSSLRPLVASGDKILLGEYSTLTKRVWVLSDPDPLENHGIVLPANTRFALALLRALRRAPNAPIVFDETVHGSVAPERNVVRLLFQFPYVVVTLQILAALVLLLMATTQRFGGAERAPPSIARGSRQLIDNIAGLMDRGGHQAVILRRYISVKLAETGRLLHAPFGLDEGALADWLDRVAASRGKTGRAQTTLSACEAAHGARGKAVQSLFEEAQTIYLWHKDMADGSDEGQGRGRSGSSRNR